MTISELRCDELAIPAIEWAVTLANFDDGGRRYSLNWDRRPVSNVVKADMDVVAPDGWELTVKQWRELSQRVRPWLRYLERIKQGKKELRADGKQARAQSRDRGARVARDILREASRLSAIIHVSSGRVTINFGSFEPLPFAALGAALLLGRTNQIPGRPYTYLSRFGKCAGPDCERFLFKPLGQATKYCDPKICGNRRHQADFKKSKKEKASKGFRP